MKLFKIETPAIYLDGGAVFGVIPKWMWQNKYKADDKNLCLCSVRCLLIEDEDRLVLIDTGVGTKHDEEDLIYGFNNDNDLENNIKKYGYSPEDVTDVILTHLHFDHCGGTTKYDDDNNLVLTFPNANHHISRLQWEQSLNPNYRERASYVKENTGLLEGSDKLKLIDQDSKISNNISVELFNGHTQGLMVPIINYNGREIAFPGDLIPIMALIPLAWISAYDVRPLDTIDEKQRFLNESYKKNRLIVFQHDYYTEACDLQKTDKGIRADKVYKIEEF